MRLSRWDALVFARAALAAVAALLLLTLVTAISDEGGLTWVERAGRVLPLTPLCGAVGVWAGLAPVASRGERLALESLGRSPAAIGAPATVGALALIASAALAIASLSTVDVSGFYPTATRAAAWHWREGSFEDAVQGLRVVATGDLVRSGDPTPQANVPKLPAHARGAAAGATVAAGLALALLAARPSLGSSDSQSRQRLPWLDGLASSGTVLFTVALFQAGAAGRVPAYAAVVPALALLGFALLRYRLA